MSKLFIFGIGGTGARVLRSLTMLLMAGVKLDNEFNEIVPIIIDKDATNGDMMRTKELIDMYMYVFEKFANKNEEGFFNTRISLLDGKLCMQLKDDCKAFSEHIKLNVETEKNAAFIKAIFSEDALNMKTTEGFRGIPSIGSVVLNQFEGHDMFKKFAKQFQDGDRIFVISSIFGGTGASGFPLLLRTLRVPNANLPEWTQVQGAPLGAISVLPYFIVNGNDEIGVVNVDSDTFHDKASAALLFYDEEFKKDKINRMYYVGDKNKSTYEYCAGGGKQKNPAHFLEMVSALSVVDFLSVPEFPKEDCGYCEFGFYPSTDVHFKNLGDSTLKVIRDPLVQFYAFKRYMDLVFQKENKYQPWSHKYPWKKDENFDKEFLQSDSMRKMQACFDEFQKWLEEMQSDKHKRKFSPFNLKAETCAFVEGYELREGGLYNEWAWFDDQLNRQDVTKSSTKEKRFLELFYKVTKKFVEKKLNNN